jgi:hypothetical protein
VCSKLHTNIVSVPSLIVDAVSASSTPNEIFLIVDTNDCIGVEQLRIRVTVNGVSLSESYSRTDFTFSNQSPGNYTCSITVEDEDKIRESRNVSCISPAAPGMCFCLVTMFSVY